MNGIPWAEIGVGGAIAAVVIVIVLAFVLKFKNGKPDRPPCVDTPEVRQAFLDNAMMKENIGRIEQHLEKVKTEAMKQTSISAQMLSTLKEIARNGKKG